jgi:hypothetical protein
MTFPVWLVSIQNLNGGWTVDTYEGEPGDPDAAVALAGDGFDFEWAFKGGTSPAGMEPKTLKFRLYAKTAADVPSCEQGDQLKVKLSRPPGDVSRNGAGVLVGAGVSGALRIMRDGFRVKDIDAVWNRKMKRMVVDVIASDYASDLGATVDVSLASGSGQVEVDAERIWQQDMAFFYRSWPNAVGSAAVPTHSTVAYANRFPPPLTEPGSGDLFPHLNVAGQHSVADLMDRVALPNFTHDGKAYIPYVVGSVADLPFVPAKPDPSVDLSPVVPSPQGNPESGVMFMAEWSPRADFDVAPLRLRVVAGKVIAEDRPSVQNYQVDGLTVLDAGHIVSSPKWLRDTAAAVNVLEVEGFAPDPDPDSEAEWVVQTLTIRDEAAVSTGTVVRSLPTFALLDDAAPPPNPDALNGHPYYQYLKDAYLRFQRGQSGWTPKSFTILTETMTDAELNSYLPRFNPVDQVQVTIVVLNIDDDENMARGSLWVTMVGCDFTITDGKLRISPLVRAFRPMVSDSPAVTWAQFAATYPTATASDLDPELTGADMALAAVS